MGAKLLTNKIKEYNNSNHNSINNTPSKLFSIQKVDTELKIANIYDIAYMFGESRKITVKKSMIIINALGRKHSYTIWDNEKANKLNRTKVNVHYHEFNMSQIYLFDLKNRFLTALHRNVNVPIIPYSDSDIKNYQSHATKRTQMIERNLKDLYEEILVKTENIKPIPILDHDNKIFNQSDILSQNVEDEIERGKANMDRLKLVKQNSAYDGELKELIIRREIKKKFTLKTVS